MCCVLGIDVPALVFLFGGVARIFSPSDLRLPTSIFRMFGGLISWFVTCSRILENLCEAA